MRNRLESESLPSKESQESSFNSKSETIGKNHPKYIDKTTVLRGNVTRFEIETRSVCCGNKSERCCII